MSKGNQLLKAQLPPDESSWQRCSLFFRAKAQGGKTQRAKPRLGLQPRLVHPRSLAFSPLRWTTASASLDSCLISGQPATAANVPAPGAPPSCTRGACADCKDVSCLKLGGWLHLEPGCWPGPCLELKQALFWGVPLLQRFPRAWGFSHLLYTGW